MDEYISREAVNDLIEDIRNNHFILMSDRVTLVLLKSKVAEIPTSDVQPVKRGRWIDIYEWAKMHDSTPSGMCTYYWCSKCQTEQEKRSNFCPNCGARMDGDTYNNMRNLTDEETAIYEGWIESEAKDTGVNIMDGEQNENN